MIVVACSLVYALGEKKKVTGQQPPRLGEGGNENFLLEKLHARVSLYDAKITHFVPHLLEYDLSLLIAALNDDTDTYIINLVSKLHEQLKYRRTWSTEQRRDYPFWYNPKI